MKKLIFLVSISLILLGGCAQDYNDIKPEKPVIGTVVNIDSAQWTPVLIQIENDHMLLYTPDNTIKKIHFWDPAESFGLGVLVCVIIILFFIILIATD